MKKSTVLSRVEESISQSDLKSHTAMPSRLVCVCHSVNVLRHTQEDTNICSVCLKIRWRTTCQLSRSLSGHKEQTTIQSSRWRSYGALNTCAYKVAGSSGLYESTLLKKNRRHWVPVHY